jgi:thiol-disulfide isomerase/thioredoxin
MLSLANRKRARVGSSLLAALGVFGFVLGADGGDDPRTIQEIHRINFEWEQAMIKAASARRSAKSPIELERVRKDFATTERRFVERCLDVANRNPGGVAGLISLKLVACRSAETEEGKQAAETLVKEAASADLDVLAKALPFPANASDGPIHLAVPIILDRVKKNPDHPRAAQLLASFVCASVDRDAAKPPPEFIEAANLIVERYSDSPQIRNFCELSGCRWAGPFERHLRTILDRNAHRDVRAAASYALASVVQEAGENRQAEAETLYEDYIKTFDGKEKYFFADIEKDWNDRAKEELAVLRSLGKPAPEIDGVGLDGRGMKLSEYGGKVVLLSFWATWCGPCMKMIPHERDLIKRFEGKPFVIVGVNGDDDQQAAKDAAVTHGITWRSFQDKNERQKISFAWHVWGWPTFYLIDQKGIVRKRWVDVQPDELNRAIDQLIDAQTENQTAK